MAKMCFRAKDGKVAIWQKPASGDPMAPFDDPLNHMDLVRFHSDFQFMNSRLTALSVAVNHTAVAGVTGTGYGGVNNGGSASSGSTTPIADGQIASSEYVLYTHNLGYAPVYFVLYQGTVISGAMGVQKGSNQLRLVSAFSTTTQIKLKDFGISSKTSLAAVTRNYDVYIFKDLAPDLSKPLFRAKLNNPNKGITMGHGKVANNEDTVRRQRAGDTLDLPVPVSRQADIRNGDIRSILADGSFTQLGKYNGSLFSFDFVPVTFG